MNPYTIVFWDRENNSAIPSLEDARAIYMLCDKYGHRVVYYNELHPHSFRSRSYPILRVICKTSQPQYALAFILEEFSLMLSEENKDIIYSLITNNHGIKEVEADTELQKLFKYPDEVYDSWQNFFARVKWA